MTWDEGQTMQARFEHAGQAGHDLHPHWKLGESYGGFTAAWDKQPAPLIQALVHRFQRQMRDMAGESWTVCGWTACAAAGARLEAPHTQANEAGLGCAGKEKTAPQVFLTTLRHLGLGLTRDFRNGPGADSERHHLRDMLSGLPPQSLLVADAGFAGYALCRDILAQGHSFLFRVGGNVTLLTGLGWHFEERDGLVDLWPLEFRDQPPLTLRLIRLPQGKQTVCLLTSVLDGERLSDADAAALYALRWGIEVGYRSSKQTLDRRTLLSRTPETCLWESAWTLLGLWLLGLMSVRRQLEAGRPPRGWSTARARDAVRDALRFIGRRRTGLDRALRDAVHDSYQRRRSKAARNYPRKKKETPPSPPKIKPAKSKEVQLAARLREQERLIL